ncbi:hypothetical protein EG835_11355 [bacterium]|nr:hypothetical protein [bacterium]
MPRIPDPALRERSALAGDAWLLTAGLVGLFFAFDLAVFWVGDRVGAPPVLMEAVSSLTFLTCIVAGAFVALRMHGRRADWMAAAGGLIGVPLGGAVVAVLAMLVGGVSWVLSPLVKSEFIVPVVFLCLAGAALVAVTIWLIRDAWRDLKAETAVHRGLDIARIVALLSVVILGGASVYTLVAQFGSEAGEAIIFAMFAGIVSAAVATTADVFSGFMAARRASASGGAVGPA